MSWEEAQDVRRRAGRVPMERMAEEYGVSATTIRNIVRGRTYREPEQRYHRPTRPGPPAGSQPANRKLTDLEAAEIRYRAEHGDAQLALADEFGVSPATISNIVHGRLYRRALLIEWDPEQKAAHEWSRKGKRAHNRKLTQGQAARARREYLEGEDSVETLAERYGLSGRAMHQLLAGETYAHPDYDPGPVREKMGRRAREAGLGRTWNQERRRRPKVPGLDGLPDGTRREFRERLRAYYRDEYGLDPDGAGGHHVGAVRWFAELLEERLGTFYKRLRGDDGCGLLRRHWLVLHLLEQARLERVRARAATREVPEGSTRAAFARFR